MKVEIKQNTKDWQIWRGKGLGASDAPIIMGDSPWTTRFQLWGQKTGLIERPAPNSFQLQAMQRGHDLEPEARKRYEESVGLDFPPTSFEHDKYPFLRASLDGYNERGKMNLEIKCPGRIDHQTAAVNKQIPSKYFAQIQMQMLVSGAEACDYVSWDGKYSFVVIMVVEDREYQKKLLKELLAFWKLVETKTPPTLEEGELEGLIIDLTKTLTRCQKTLNLLSSLNDIFIDVTKGDK